MMKGHRTRKWRTGAFSLVAVTLGLCAALLLAEAVFRVADIGSDQFLRQDPVLGVRFIPSRRGLSQGPCYSVRPTISADGWRDRPHARVKAQDVFRVLVLGDSFMAGLQVEDDETFSARLEARLNGAGPLRFEVLNFGVPSWGTDQEFLALRELGTAFRPDLVVLAFYAQNDVSDNFAISGGTGYPKPTFDIEGGDLVEIPFHDATPAAIAFARRLAAPFRLYPWTRDALMKIPVAHRALYQMGIVGVPPRKLRAIPREQDLWHWPDRWTHQVRAYARNAPSGWTHAWDVTERLILAARDEAHQVGADFLLVDLPSPIAVIPPQLLARIQSVSESGPLDQDLPLRRLSAFATQHSIELQSLVANFRTRIPGTTEMSYYYLPCDGHFTALGHAVAADLVAPRVLQLRTRTN